MLGRCGQNGVLKPCPTILSEEFDEFNKTHSLGLDESDLNHWKSIFADRPATSIELFDLAQSWRSCRGSRR